MSDDRRRKRFTMIATILGSTIVFLDATVVNVALPAISDDLNAGLADQQWVVEAYSLATVALLLVGGALGDQFGRGFDHDRSRAELVVGGDGDPPQLDAALGRQDLPRHDVGVVLHVREHDRIALAQVGACPRVRHQVDRLGRVAHVDDLVGVMTPDMSASELVLSRRTEVTEERLRTHWRWGDRFAQTNDPREYTFFVGKNRNRPIHAAAVRCRFEPSRQMFLEDKIGTLEVGKRADIAVWDRDLYSVSYEQIKDLKCLMTLLDGEVVYASQDSPVTIGVR